MNKVAKYSIFFIGTCAALFVVALLVFSSVVDPNDYKDRISRIVLEETGRTLVFDGDLDLLLFPNVGIEMGAVSLSNNADFGPDPMIRASSVSVSVRVLPLLLGKVKFGKLILEDLVLNMGRAVDGTTNWEDIVGRQEKTDADAQVDEPFSLEVAGVSVSNGSLLWDDRKTETKFILRGIDLTTGKIAEGSLFPVDVSLNFECSRPDARGVLKIRGKSSIDLVNREYGHMDMQVSVDAQGQSVPGGSVKAVASFNFMALDFNKEHAQITGLNMSAYGTTVHVDGTVEGITQGLKAAAGVLTVDQFDVQKTMVAMGEKPLNVADSTALTSVGGMVDFSFVHGKIDMKTLKIDVDGARIVGNARVERGHALPSCFARLDVGKLDLDRYLPLEHEAQTAAAKEAVASGDSDDVVLSAKVLRELNVDIEAKVAELKLAQAHFQSVTAQLTAQDGLVKFSPVMASAYGGSVKLDAIASAVEKTPKADVAVQVKSLDIGALSRDIDKDSKYAGIADFDATLMSRGERIQTMRRTLNGKLSFHLADGVFPGVNVVKMARETHSRESKGGKVEGDKTEYTRFGSIKGTGVIKDGILKNEDLEVMAPGLRAHGHGAVSLINNKIDYMVKAKLVPQAGGQGGETSDDLFGVLVPIHVTGTLDNPQYWVSVTEYVKALGGAVVGVVGSVFGGVTNAIKGVGSALDESCCEDTPASTKTPQKKKFLGIF
ncbi:cell envelope biogenesis protein AsmA [Pseudodesulfovibrio nedwellii]|uniref:Cell envelope biogenesis protein AsmA n=1 Tax=Pseudodesulfovibrio nedwellii TaxID=2973072 RepID=A0ABN6S111_9BACT|nr:AsmA family protein [Pseudodesulfovibrio nedwellii]BDQ36896.1 cell envelope biogenesis protein AsmA [Pseudodesulfovibrio nedwellii]